MENLIKTFAGNFPKNKKELQQLTKDVIQELTNMNIPKETTHEVLANDFPKATFYLPSGSLPVFPGAWQGNSSGKQLINALCWSMFPKRNSNHSERGIARFILYVYLEKELPEDIWGASAMHRPYDLSHVSALASLLGKRIVVFTDDAVISYGEGEEIMLEYNAGKFKYEQKN